MKNDLNRQLIHVEQKESRLLAKMSCPAAFRYASPAKWKLPIPDGLNQTLEGAFYKGFQLIFGKGSRILEKTYDKEQLLLDHELHELGYTKKPSRKNLSRISRQADKSVRFNRLTAAVEGSVLGVLGIGLPDIPLFIGTLLRTIYEIALSYGFSYDEPEEQYYILKLIEASLAGPETLIKLNAEIDAAAYGLNRKQSFLYDLSLQMQAASRSLAAEMITMKFIQGLPIVGVVGGISNFTCHKKIIDYVRIKYEKRYLLFKQL